jgi:hypothetical protein
VAESDRDILIAVKTKVDEIHRDMTQPGGRVPRLEGTVEEHSAQLNQLSGSVGTSKWFLAGIGALVLALISVLASHLLGGR